MMPAAEGVNLQRTALAAHKSLVGQTLPDVEEMAAMGNWGRNSSHIAEQLTVRYCQSKHLGLPEPHVAEIPALVRNNVDCAITVIPKKIGIYLPHDWFAWMGGLDSDAKEALTGQAGLVAFWEEHDIEGDPKMKGSPIKKSQIHKYWPLIVHGDGGQFQRSDSINVMSMRCLLSAANVATSQLLLLALPKACVNKSSVLEEDTTQAVWKVLVWSFIAMFHGKHPAGDHLGNAWPLNSNRRALQGQHLQPGKCMGFIFALAGDGEWFQNEDKLPGFAFNDCCFNCKANKSDIPFNDFRANATLRTTTIKHEGTCPTEHAVASIPGVVGETFAYDSLHILEEGVAAHAIGNVFFDFVVKPGWAGTQDAKMKQLYQKIMREYLEQGIDSEHRVSKLSLSNFCNPKSKFSSFPVLTGLKARQIRYLLPCVLAICKEEEQDAYDKHRTACLQNLESMYQCLLPGFWGYAFL